MSTLRQLTGACIPFCVITGILATLGANADCLAQGGPSSSPALAADDVVRVEEDWVLHIANPDPAADCPHVCCIFGPDDPKTGTYGIFELNHSTAPTYQSGGYQLHAWSADRMLGYRRNSPQGNLHVSIEQVSFTTVTAIDAGFIVLSISNGQSASFGQFGDTTTTEIKVKSKRLTLNDHNPAHALEHSRVTYGTNRVNSYVRSEVRNYNSAGELISSSDNSGQGWVIHRLAEDQYAPDAVNGDD